MVVPDCGVPMSKPRDLREPIPSDMIALQRMWCNALAAAIAPPADCVFCKQTRDREIVKVCALCSTPMRDLCGANVSAEFSHRKLFAELLPARCTGGVIPGWWIGRLCPLCYRTQVGHI